MQLRSVGSRPRAGERGLVVDRRGSCGYLLVSLVGSRRTRTAAGSSASRSESMRCRAAPGTHDANLIASSRRGSTGVGSLAGSAASAIAVIASTGVALRRPMLRSSTRIVATPAPSSAWASARSRVRRRISTTVTGSERSRGTASFRPLPSIVLEVVVLVSPPGPTARCSRLFARSPRRSRRSGAVWADTENGDGGDAEGGDVAVGCDRAPKRCWGLGEARDLATWPRMAGAMCSSCSSPVTRRPC